MKSPAQDEFGPESRTVSPYRRFLDAAAAMLFFTALLMSAHGQREAERRATILARACHVGVGPTKTTTGSIADKLGPDHYLLVADRVMIFGSFKGKRFGAWRDKDGTWLQRPRKDGLCVREAMFGRPADPELAAFLEAYTATGRGLPK